MTRCALQNGSVQKLSQARQVPPSIEQPYAVCYHFGLEAVPAESQHGQHAQVFKFSVGPDDACLQQSTAIATYVN